MTPSSDHDLLIQIDTKLNLLQDTVKSIGPQLALKADRDDFIELKHEVTQLQQFKWKLLGALVAIQGIGTIVLHFIK